MFKSTRPGARPIRFNAGRFYARALVALLLAGMFQARPQTPAEPQSSNQPSSKLTNADILQLHAAGLGDEVILAKIRASTCNFSTAPTDLTKLKSAGISDDVIVAMIGASAPPEPPAQPAPPPADIPAPPDPTAKATLHFYRERAFVGSARKMPVFIDDVQVAELVNGRQFTITAEPGVHVFRSRTRPEAIELELEPGGEYYLRAEVSQDLSNGYWRIVQVGNAQGKLDLERLKPLDVKHIAPPARTP